jgi:hypothetical protein
VKTKCLDTLEWFIKKSEKDKWFLSYDKKLNTTIFGVIEDSEYEGYVFKPVLHGGKYVYGVVIKE